MELPVSFLQDCARADKWLPFVCHAQACQFPKEQVLLRCNSCFGLNMFDFPFVLEFGNESGT